MTARRKNRRKAIKGTARLKNVYNNEKPLKSFLLLLTTVVLIFFIYSGSDWADTVRSENNPKKATEKDPYKAVEDKKSVQKPLDNNPIILPPVNSEREKKERSFASEILNIFGLSKKGKASIFFLDSLLDSAYSAYPGVRVNRKISIDRQVLNEKAYLPKGRPLPSYAADIFRTVKNSGITSLNISEAEEKKDRIVITIKHQGDIFRKISLFYASELPEGSTVIALLITDLPEPQKACVIADQLGIPVNIAWLPPEGQILKIPEKNSETEFICMIPMEPENYQYKKPPQNTILLHYSEKRIGETIDNLYSTFRGYHGACMYMGKRAAQDKETMIKTFGFLRKKYQYFVDNSFSERSKILAAAKETGIKTVKADAIINKDASFEKAERIVFTTVKKTRRKGTPAVLITEYSAANLKNLEKILKKEINKDIKFTLISEIL
ncbi:MAG: divergent polysaccharide deacetylase family protein [Fibrobacterota bacterium]